MQSHISSMFGHGGVSTAPLPQHDAPGQYRTQGGAAPLQYAMQALYSNVPDNVASKRDQRDAQHYFQLRGVRVNSAASQLIAPLRTGSAPDALTSAVQLAQQSAAAGSSGGFAGMGREMHSMQDAAAPYQGREPLVRTGFRGALALNPPPGAHPGAAAALHAGMGAVPRTLPPERKTVFRSELPMRSVEIPDTDALFAQSGGPGIDVREVERNQASLRAARRNLLKLQTDLTQQVRM